VFWASFTGSETYGKKPLGQKGKQNTHPKGDFDTRKGRGNIKPPGKTTRRPFKTTTAKNLSKKQVKEGVPGPEKWAGSWQQYAQSKNVKPPRLTD